MGKQDPRVVQATAPGRGGKAPQWLKKANRLVVALQRAGLVIGQQNWSGSALSSTAFAGRLAWSEEWLRSFMEQPEEEEPMT